MRKAALNIAILSGILIGLTLRTAQAQAPLPVDIRCYLENPAPTSTLADITWRRSNLLKRYVCLQCGYSSDRSGTCPDVWSIHGGALALVDMGTGANTRRDRVLNIPEWNMPSSQADLMWHSYAPPVGEFYRSLVGIPFCPSTRGTATTYTSPADPRGYRWNLRMRAAIQIGGGLDLDPENANGVDIQSGASFHFVVLMPEQWPAAEAPKTAADLLTAAGWIVPAVPQSLPVSAQGIIDGSGLDVVQDGFIQGKYGVGRVYMEWCNPPDDPANPNSWHFATPGGVYLNTAFYLSRLEVPTDAEMAQYLASQPPALGIDPTPDSWRNAGGPGTRAAAELPGSYLARILVGSVLPGNLIDDLYMPGATTARRNFTVINRDDTRMVEHVELTQFQAMATAPGAPMRAAGRPTVRPILPASALFVGPSTVGAGSVAAKAIDNSHWVQARIPSYQPASEPGDNLGHTPDNNWGYRGVALLYSDEAGAPNRQWDMNLSANLDAVTDMVEEYAPFDMQLSVDRQTRLASDTGTAEPGRVAPGVPSNFPDTTVGAPPPGRFPYPSNVALTDPLRMSNEGNVQALVFPVTANQATAEPVGVGSKYRSLGRYLSSNPVWLPFVAYSTLTNATMPAGWRGSALGWGTRGFAGLGTTGNPLPLGQGAGQYSSQVVYFQDLNTNGNLDFIDSVTGAPTTTATSFFDPRRDEPLEPVTFVPTATRVTESRLPFNDYYAADTEPTLRFDYNGGAVSNLQVLWVSNRASVATGAGAGAGTNPAQAAQPAYPGNVVYVNATPALVAGAPDYRPYVWDFGNGARALTGTTVNDNPGSANSSPESFSDTGGTHWTLWDQLLRSAVPAAGAAPTLARTLRYTSSANSAWGAASNFLYATGLPKQGIRGFADPTGTAADPKLWMFWTEGDQGHQTLHYRWNFSGAVDNQEALVPVSNAVTPEWRVDVINDFVSGAPMRKPSTSPFVYCKDPTAFLWTAPAGVATGTQVNVVFSGYTARQQNEDICWAAFDQASMNLPAQNYGKLTFPRVVNNLTMPATNAGGTTFAGEQLVGDGLRQTFSSRHLDWLISPTFESAALGARDGRDPRFYLGLFSSTSPATPAMYSVGWTAGRYNRARGVYTVTPIFTPLGSAPALPAGILGNPLGPGGANSNQVTMEIEPSTGTITFSAALFNPANPNDVATVFNRGVLANLVNVVMYADYTPFIFRVTTSDAADDSPNAFAEVNALDPNQLRLVFLWRRSYSQKDTPSFGRTDFMYKTWTLGAQVARPPMAGAPTVQGWTGGGWANLNAGQGADYTVNAGSGLVTMVADGYAGRNGATTRGVFWLQSAYDGARILVSYPGGTEQHRIIGWSAETSAPVDTVQNEGPLRAVPEIYTVLPGTGGAMPAVRYWLIWSSPRPIYDLRLAGNSGSVLHQSSDIYMSSIVPRYGAALREQEVAWQNVEQ